MKTTLTPIRSKSFRPFKLEIIVESEDEALELWHRFHLTSFTIIKHSSGMPYPENWDLFTLWKKINDYLRGA